MTRAFQLLYSYDEAIRQLTKATVQYKNDADVVNASIALAKARKELAEYLDALEENVHG